MAELPSKEDFKDMPKIYAVILAVRAARRVQPLALLATKLPNYEKVLCAIDNGLEASQNYLLNKSHYLLEMQNAYEIINVENAIKHSVEVSNEEPIDKTYAQAASYAAHSIRSASYAIYAALAAAQLSQGGIEKTLNAADGAFHTFADADEAVCEDYEFLSRSSKNDPRLIAVVDTSEDGPLGLYWPKGEPDWYKKYYPQMQAFLKEPNDYIEKETRKRIEESNPKTQIVVDFIGSNFSEEEISACLEYVSEIYRKHGGEGLKVIKERILTLEFAEVVE